MTVEDQIYDKWYMNAARNILEIIGDRVEGFEELTEQLNADEYQGMLEEIANHIYTSEQLEKSFY